MGEQLFCAFLVVGPDPSLRPLEGSDTKSQGCVFLKTLLGTTYGATTLACYPPKLPEFVPPSIWLFALPRAIRYTTSRDTTAPECFSFAVSSRSGVTLFGTSLTYLRQVDPQIQQKVTDEEYSPIESTLYAPHTVCLLSRLPLMSLGRRWLIEISKIIFEGRKKGGSSLPLESFLWNMISVSRVPPEGYTLLIPTPLGGTYPLYRPTEWEFPFLDMPIGHIFMSLDLRSIIMLVGSLYQEKRLLLVSKSKTLLFHVAHTLVTLIYPLTWNYTYIPVLPDRLMNFVTSDRPYILGVHSDALAREEVKSQIGKVVIANLDDNTVSIPPGVADPPQFEIKQLEGAMNHILATNLNDLDSPSTLPSNEPPRIPRFEEMIKVSFLNFFLSLFGEFRHFLLFLMEKPKVVAYLEAHKLTHHYLCVAEKRIRGCRKGMMMWEMVGSGLLVEERGEDDGGVDDGKSKKSPLEEVQMDNEVEKIYSFYMKVVKTKMFWHFCQKFSEPGNSVVDLWLQHKDRQKEQFDAHKMKRKGKEEGSDMQGGQGEKEGEELFEEISGFVEEHLSDPFYPSPYAQSVAPASSSSSFIVSSLSPAFISEKMGKKKKKFVYENGFPTSFSNSFLEASQDLENEGSFVRMMRSLAPLCIPGSAPDPVPRDLPFIPRPKELKAKKALEKFIGAVLQHQDVDSSSLYDYFTDAVALVTSLSAFPIRRDLVGVLKYSTSRHPSTPSSSSSSSSFSPSDSKRIELDPNIFELLGAIVECALLQCQERKDLQTAMLFYEVSGNFILKRKVKHKKERKSLEGRGGGEEEPLKYISSDGDMSDDLSGREGGEGEGERKTAGDFGEESISLRDRFSMSGIWSEEELWVAHLADRIQAMKQRYPGKSVQKDGRSLYVKAIVEEAVEMLRFGISADKVKAVVDWCSKTGDLSQKDCKTLLNHLEAAVSESNVMKQQDRSSKRRAQGLYSRDLRKLGLDRADWNSLLATGKLTKFTSGDVIMKYEEQLSCLFVVKKGTVRVDKPGLGSSSTMTAYLEQDRLFGEMCLLDQNAKAAATITAAAERTEIISIPCAKVFEMFERRPELTTAVARSLALSLSNALKHQQDDRQMFSPPAKQRKKAIFKKTDAIARYSVTYKTKLIKKKGLLCVLIEGLYFLSDKKQKSVKRWKYENLQLFQGEKNNEMVVEDSSLQGSQFVLKMASIKELEELTSFVSQAQSGWGGHRGDIVTTLKTKQRLSNVPDRETPQLLTLGDEDWNWLLHMTQCVAYHRDDVIIEEGSKQRRLIQIGSGHVRIVKKVVVSSDSGSPVDSYDEDFSDLSTDARTDVEEMVLGRMGFGEVLGTINYLESGGATASVIADDETVDIYLLEGPVVDLLISTRKGFGGRFYTFLCSELMDCLAQRMN